MKQITQVGKASAMIIDGLQSRGESSDIAKWRHVDVNRLDEFPDIWISITRILHAIGWREPDTNGFTRDEKTVALIVHMYALAWSNKNKHPHDPDIQFGKALRTYHESIKDTTKNDGLSMIRKIASSTTFEQKAYFIERLIPRIAKVSNFDYYSFADSIVFLQVDSQKNNVIRRWMNDFYTK